MGKAPFAKALTKHVYKLGAPIHYLLPGYLIPGLIWLITGWLWYLMPLGLVWHVFVVYKFKRDEYWVSYFFDAFLEKMHLEP